jgi:transcriptional antiterminator
MAVWILKMKKWRVKKNFPLEEKYPLCYNLLWKLNKVVQQTFKMNVFGAETIYL